MGAYTVLRLSWIGIIDISKSTITLFLKKIGKSFITGRPAHPKKNLAINEKWERDCFFKINELVTEILKKDPNIKIEFWHEDESRIGQKGHSTRSWFNKGTRQRVLVQNDFKSTKIFAALNPSSGELFSLILPKTDSEIMNLFLEALSKSLPFGVHIILQWDNASFHTSKKIKNYENITLFFQPPYSPEYNALERLWQYIKSKFLANRVYKDEEELVLICVEVMKKMKGLPEILKSLSNGFFLTKEKYDIWHDEMVLNF